jgi:hypothetical protein
MVLSHQGRWQFFPQAINQRFNEFGITIFSKEVKHNQTSKKNAPQRGALSIQIF